MGTELLKEQYNFLLNNQNSKLDKLREKKRLINQKKNSNEDDDTNFNIEKELYPESLKNDEFELDLASKIEKYDLMDSSDENNDDEKILNSSQKKIIFKKSKKVSENQERIQYQPTNDDYETIRESSIHPDKLREIQDENGRLRKVLAEKDYEINFLKRKLETEEKNLGIGQMSHDVAASKIVDLAKKVRELTAQMESEKTKNKQLTKTCKDLEVQVQNFKDKKSCLDDNDINEEDSESFESTQSKNNFLQENKELKEKLNQTSHKMMEYKSQCEILKQDLKKTQKALEKEVGEKVDIKAILSGQSNWRGRQQQIRNLQTKLSDLKQKIGVMDGRESETLVYEEDLDNINKNDMPRSAQISLLSGYISNTASVRNNLDSRHRSDLKRLEKDKKELIEKMKQENETMEAELNGLKEKFEASKARNKVLSNENKNFKDQVKTLLEKGKHDDELIDALMKKQNQLKEILANLNYQNEKASKEIEEKSVEVQVKTMQEKNTIEQMKSIIAEREKRVKQLEDELSKLKENDYTSQKSKANEFFLVNNNNDTNKRNTSPKNENVESEFIKSRPLSSNRSKEVTVNRSDSTSLAGREFYSSRHTIQSAKSSNMSTCITSLNAKTVDKVKERNVDLKLENCELKTLYKTSEIEKMRLQELVKSLQKRIEEMNEKSLENENKLNEERRRAANLEKQIEKFKLQDSKSNNANKQKNQTISSSIDQYKFEELETSLLIQKDENDAIKAALKSTLEAKEEDLRLYCEMLESTKRVFLDGLKQYKNISSNN